MFWTDFSHAADLHLVFAWFVIRKDGRFAAAGNMAINVTFQIFEIDIDQTSGSSLDFSKLQAFISISLCLFLFYLVRNQILDESLRGFDDSNSLFFVELAHQELVVLNELVSFGFEGFVLVKVRVALAVRVVLVVDILERLVDLFVIDFL